MTASSLYLNHHQSNRAPLGCSQDNQDRRQKSVLWVIMVRLKPKFTQKWVQAKRGFFMCLLSYFCCFLLKMLFILSLLNPQVLTVLTPTWCYDEKLLKKKKKAATQDISQSYFNFVSEQHNWARAQSVPVVHQVPHYILQTALRNFLSPSNPYRFGVCVCHRGHRVFCEIMLQLYLELCSSSWLANLARFSQ